MNSDKNLVDHLNSVLACLHGSGRCTFFNSDKNLVDILGEESS